MGVVMREPLYDQTAAWHGQTLKTRKDMYVVMYVCAFSIQSQHLGIRTKKVSHIYRTKCLIHPFSSIEHGKHRNLACFALCDP
jgi:hypothetical protein